MEGVRTNLDVLRDLLEVLEEMDPLYRNHDDELACSVCGRIEPREYTTADEQHRPDCKYRGGLRELKAMIAVEEVAWAQWKADRAAKKPEPGSREHFSRMFALMGAPDPHPEVRCTCPDWFDGPHSANEHCPQERDPTSDEADALRYALATVFPQPAAEPGAIELYIPYAGWFQPDGDVWTKIPRPKDWRRARPRVYHENHDHPGYREAA